jgi:hypothetical protein
VVFKKGNQRHISVTLKRKLFCIKSEKKKSRKELALNRKRLTGKVFSRRRPSNKLKFNMRSEKNSTFIK